MIKLILSILAALTMGAAGMSAVITREVQPEDPLQVWSRQEVQTQMESQFHEQTHSQQTGTGLMLQEQVMNQFQAQQMNQNGIEAQPQSQLQTNTLAVPDCDCDQTQLQLHTADKLQDQIRQQDRDRIHQSRP